MLLVNTFTMHHLRCANNCLVPDLTDILAKIFYARKFPRLWIKSVYKNGSPRGPRERVPDVISPRRVYKHFRLMQMQNDPADIMKKITRHVVSIDNEGTDVRVHADT